ncbi:ABC transporter ATP-binding protein [Limnohabitans sp. Rim8]|uniref:ABC transporter ATP-binding protein n=1 Tax=Limnohabitans sp. Rim8 TaxID=1100718 RepID=UPI00261E2F58|nr:oligopeptide/dipeptide ABC transporter ATP-binding protein [Limnohabitans sp. Rim8]
MSGPILSVKGLSKSFELKGSWGRSFATLRAVDDVSFDIFSGETLGLVGESGSGKSTIGRSVVGLLKPTQGVIQMFGTDISHDNADAFKKIRRKVQIVFQDPQGSLNPRMRIENAIAEPLDISGEYSPMQRADRVKELIELVGLPRDCGKRFSHEFSGGQRQRIGIARALALNPDFIVCDEPVSALDVSMQAQVVNLLLDLQEKLNLSYLFIAHDLAVVRHVSTRVAVMYAGRIVELAPRLELYSKPLHPYTQALMDAVPLPRPGTQKAVGVPGEVPSLLNPPSGCAFHTRCPKATQRCSVEKPDYRQITQHHYVACHLIE